MGTNDSFVVYCAWKEHLEILSDEERGQLFLALIDYISMGTIPRLSPAAGMAFSFMRQQMDKDKSKYAARCRQNKKNIEKRWEQEDTNKYGQLQTDTTVYEPIQDDTQNTDNDHDNDYDTANAVYNICPSTGKDKSAGEAAGKDKSACAYKEIIDYLNERAGTNFQSTSKDARKHIKARYAEGYRLEDFKSVIDKKCREWMGGDMQGYLRPRTLFGSKFADYLGQLSPGEQAVRKGRENAFKNFEERSYDMDSLEAELLRGK